MSLNIGEHEVLTDEEEEFGAEVEEFGDESELSSTAHPVFATVPDGESEILYWEESMGNYCKGGLHPVILGDSFKDGRYTIRHKLDRCPYFTVWAARDNMLDIWVAIKVLQARHTGETREASTLQALAERAPEGLDSKYIAKLLDYFLHEGPNGTHGCLVFELYGPSLQYTMEHGRVHLVDGARSRSAGTNGAEFVLPVAEQVLSALTFIHEAGYAHGNLHANQVALTSSQFPYMTEAQLFDVFGKPERVKIFRRDGRPLGEGMPHEYVRTAEPVTWWPDEIRLINFDSSFSHGDKDTPFFEWRIHLFPPERLLKDTIDYRADLWAAGMMLPAMALELWSWWNDAQCEASLLEEMRTFLGGDMPDEWKPKFEKMYYEHVKAVLTWNRTVRAGANADGERGEAERAADEVDDASIAAYDARNQSAEQLFEATWRDRDVDPLLPVVKGLMALRPADRLSAREAGRQAQIIADRWRASRPEEREEQADGPDLELEVALVKEYRRQPRAILNLPRHLY